MYRRRAASVNPGTDREFVLSACCAAQALVENVGGFQSTPALVLLRPAALEAFPRFDLLRDLALVRFPFGIGFLPRQNRGPALRLPQAAVPDDVIHLSLHRFGWVEIPLEA